MEEEIDLREYIEVILRRWKWIGGITLAAVVTAAIVSFFVIAPVYEAKAGVVIVKSKSEITFDPKYRTLSEEELAPLIGNQARRQALEALIKSNSVAAEVVANLGAMLEPEERDVSALLEMVEAGTVYRREQPIKWKCSVCGYVHEGTEPPDECPSCKHAREYYEPANLDF